MSSDEADRVAGTAPVPEEYDRLERRVRRLLDDTAGFRARARVAEDRVAELERTMRDVSSGDLDPLQLRHAVQRLEQENVELRGRIQRAQDRVRKLVARFEFLREEL